MTERAPVLHLQAGPNGAGKTTLYRALVAHGVIHEALEFVNADHYERHHLQYIMDVRDLEAGGLQLAAVCQGAQTRQIAGLLPPWARQLLGDMSR